MFKKIFNKNKFPVELGLVVVDTGKVLLGKRKNAQGVEEWGFPNGPLKRGEKIQERALNVLSQTTGLKGLCIRLGPWTDEVIEKKHDISLYVFIEFFEGELAAEQWQWFDWNDLPTPLASPISSLISTIGIERLKQTSCPSCASLQKMVFRVVEKDAHPLFIKLISSKE